MVRFDGSFEEFVCRLGRSGLIMWVCGEKKWEDVDRVEVYGNGRVNEEGSCVKVWMKDGSMMNVFWEW